MSRQVTVRKKAEKSLLKLTFKQRERILQKIKSLAEDPYPRGCTKLTAREEYRIRVGVYRVLYTVTAAEVTIEAVDHRKDAYR